MLTKKFQSLDPIFDKFDKSIKEESKLRQEAQKNSYLVKLKKKLSKNYHNQQNDSKIIYL